MFLQDGLALSSVRARARFQMVDSQGSAANACLSTCCHSPQHTAFSPNVSGQETSLTVIATHPRNKWKCSHSNSVTAFRTAYFQPAATHSSADNATVFTTEELSIRIIITPIIDQHLIFRLKYPPVHCRTLMFLFSPASAWETSGCPQHVLVS